MLHLRKGASVDLTVFVDGKFFDMNGPAGNHEFGKLFLQSGGKAFFFYVSGVVEDDLLFLLVVEAA